jgi:multisubunit Na+/H+ antiporter MnhF subunit
VFTWRVSSIVVFALVLAAVVQMTRVTLGEETPDRVKQM